MNANSFVSTNLTSFQLLTEEEQDISSAFAVAGCTSLVKNVPLPVLWAHRIDAMTVAKVELDEQNLYLVLQRSAVDFRDKYIVRVVLTGSLTIHDDGHEIIAQSGDALILDTAKHVTTKNPHGIQLIAVLPRNIFEKSLFHANLHGMVLNRERPTTRLLVEFLASLGQNSQSLARSEAIAMQDAFVSLLVASINGTTNSCENALIANLSLRRRILRYIDDNLLDPSLSPDTLRQRLKISRSHLYRCFEQDGGVTKLIRNKRLTLAYRLILTNHGKRFTLKELAYLSGFNDGNQFTKAFKSFFNFHPKDVIALDRGQELPEYSPVE